MTAAIRDLWPSVITPEPRTTPISILRHQGWLLGQKTGNLVVADVRLGQRLGNDICYVFELVAPALGYRYPVLSISHSVASPYPVEVMSGTVTGTWLDRSNGGTVANNPDEFMDEVGRVLSGASTLDVVKTLIAQSRDFAEEAP